MGKGKIKLPRSSYDELCKIIKAYGHIEKPASLAEISSLSSLGPTRVSANNAFLTEIGIIEGGIKKDATKKGKELAQALEFEIKDNIESLWREFVQKNEFLNKMALSIKIRKRMDIAAFESHIAYSAGEAKAKYVMTGSRTVIEILKASNLIKENEGQIMPGSEVEVPKVFQKNGETKLDPNAKVQIKPDDAFTKINIPKIIGNINLNIEIRITSKPSEINGLGEKILELLNKLSDFEKKDKSNS